MLCARDPGARVGSPARVSRGPTLGPRSAAARAGRTLLGFGDAAGGSEEEGGERRGEERREERTLGPESQVQARAAAGGEPGRASGAERSEAEHGLGQARAERRCRGSVSSSELRSDFFLRLSRYTRYK